MQDRLLLFPQEISPVKPLKVLLKAMDADNCGYHPRYLLYLRNFSCIYYESESFLKELDVTHITEIFKKAFSVYIDKNYISAQVENLSNKLAYFYLGEVSGKRKRQLLSEEEANKAYAELFIKHEEAWRTKHLNEFSKRMQSKIVKYFLQRKPSVLGEIFYHANSPATKKVCEEAKDYNLIFWSPFTNRGSRRLEEVNSDQNGTSFFSYDLKYYIGKINELHQLNIIYVPFMPADIWGNLPIGESLNRIEKNLPPHATSLFDRSKLTNLLAIVNCVFDRYFKPFLAFNNKVNLNPFFSLDAIHLRVDILEDLDSIHEALIRELTAHPELLPRNTSVKLNNYSGAYFYSNTLDKFSGNFVDHFYRESLAYIKEHCVFDKDNPISFDAAKSLDKKAFLKVREESRRPNRIKAAITQFSLFASGEAAIMPENYVGIRLERR